MINETIISAALLANFITWYFVPFDYAREYIVTKWVNFCLRTIKQPWMVNAVQIITCEKCLAFWGTLVYTLNPISAILASMLALFIKWMLKYVSNVE